jgi:hypothetical protein
MSFTTSELVKRRLRIPAGITTHDLLIADIIAEVNDAIVAASGNDGLAGGTFSETASVFYPGLVQRGFARFPWTSVVAMTLNDIAQVEGTDFEAELETGHILLKDGSVFPMGENNIEITYVCKDVTTDDKTLQRAATNWAVAEFNKAPHHGFKSEQMNKYKYELDDGDIPASVDSALSRYRRVLEVF